MILKEVAKELEGKSYPDYCHSVLAILFLRFVVGSSDVSPIKAVASSLGELKKIIEAPMISIIRRRS